MNAAFSRARDSALEMLARGRPLREILAYLVAEAEAASDGRAVCSVMLMDEDGLLRNGAAPGLPEDYLRAMDRLKPDPLVGTCAAAAATGRTIVTTNFLTDAGWRDLKHLPLALGLMAAWSVPILGKGGRVLGTFGTYFREQRPPRAEERTFVESLAQIASMVIEGTSQPAAA